MYYLLNLEKFKIYIRIHTNIAPSLSLILHSTQPTRHSQDMLPHHHITYKDINILI
jgi:hypothetical protein